MVFATIAIQPLAPASQKPSLKVEFRITAPSAKKVLFAGTYTSWDKPGVMEKQGDDWVFTAPLEPDARLEYKFVVDGKWILDPKNPKQSDGGFGSANSVWEGPNYKSIVPDGEPKHPLTRKNLKVDGRDVVLYVPDKSEGLPILAYGDGNAYASVGKVQNVIENLVEAHKMHPVVIVLIDPKERMKEYWQNSTSYEKFFVEEVLPAVRATTGASDQGKDVFVGGSSLGGTIALRLAEHYPFQIAGGVHSQSGAFQVDEPGLISKEALAKLAKTTKLYLDHGTYEYELTIANDRAKDTLRAMRRPFGTMVTPEGHNWPAWRHRMAAGLEYLLPPNRR